MTARAKFQRAATANAIRAARAAGLESFDIIPGPDGTPIIRAHPVNASGTSQDILDELRSHLGA